jgi:hypothetical protein
VKTTDISTSEWDCKSGSSGGLSAIVLVGSEVLVCMTESALKDYHRDPLKAIHNSFQG